MNPMKGNISSAQGMFYALFRKSNKSTICVYVVTICVHIVGYIASQKSNISCKNANVDFTTI